MLYNRVLFFITQKPIFYENWYIYIIAYRKLYLYTFLQKIAKNVANTQLYTTLYNFIYTYLIVTKLKINLASITSQVPDKLAC